jgi:hypothetical protein
MNRIRCQRHVHVRSCPLLSPDAGVVVPCEAVAGRAAMSCLVFISHYFSMSVLPLLLQRQPAHCDVAVTMSLLRLLSNAAASKYIL